MDDHSITIEENSEPCISKVHVGLRKLKPEAYKPVVVSIGPYYHKYDPDLEAMQQNKKMYLDSLLERRNKSLQRRNKRAESREILSELATLETKARKCYADPMNTIDDKEFTEMMLLDSCFVVEFIRKMNYVPFDENDPIPYDEKAAFDYNDTIKRVPWMKNQILSDMMLLENQLPYFVLSKVYNMTKSEGENPLEEMVMSCFNTMLPRPLLNSNNVKNINTGEIKHVLDLIHVLCHPFPKKTTTSNEDRNISVRTTCFSFFSERIFAKNRGNKESSDDQTCCPLLPQNNNSGSDKRYEMKNQMGTVVELQEAGVKFEKVGKIYNGALKKNREKEEEDDYVSLFDIDFKFGVLKVPCFKVDDGTETLLRNLIAYEQHFPYVRPMYFTEFACLMTQVINSKKDTKVLRFKEIIMNFLGGDDELSELFNRLADNICEVTKPYHREVCQNVDKHCKTNCNILMAKLRRDYFKNPWAGVSTDAAAFLLLLTVGQFVIALLTLLA